MSTPPIAMLEIERIIEQAGKAGIQPIDIAKVRGVTAQIVSRPIRRLMLSGKIARKQVSHRRVVYFVKDMAPADAEVIEPISKDKPASDKNRLTSSHHRCIDVLREVGEQGATVEAISLAIPMNANNVAMRLNDLERSGFAKWRRDAEGGKGHLRKRWFLSEHAPAVVPFVLPKGPSVTVKQRGLDLSQPTIIPDGVKVTKCPGFVANQRYAVDPSIAGNGVISRDWMERRA